MSTFGERVRAGMAGAAIESAARLGKRCNVSRQTASAWIGLKEPDLNAKHLVTLARVLNVSPRFLLTGDVPPVSLTPWREVVVA